MSGFAWMAWTWQTALFFATIAALLTVMTALAILRPETPRMGVLRFPTTRGDRLFIALLGAAFIHLAWVGLAGPSLWWAMAVSLVYAALVFRYV
jgi:predicted small integral membrane protein